MTEIRKSQTKVRVSSIVTRDDKLNGKANIVN